MPGNTLRFAATPLEASKLLFASFGGFGVLPGELPTMGEHGPSFLLDDVDPGDENTEIRPRITAVPSAGTFTADEYGRFLLAGAPAGTYTFRYIPIVGITELAEATETIINGTSLAQFAGALPALAWAGTVQLDGPRAQWAGALQPLAWAGAVELNRQTAIGFAAVLQGLAWLGSTAPTFSPGPGRSLAWRPLKRTVRMPPLN